METEDVPLGLWLSVLAAIAVVAWFLGDDITSERRRRQLAQLERLLLWTAALVLVAGGLAALVLAMRRWIA
jgi:hypothetical protein